MHKFTKKSCPGCGSVVEIPPNSVCRPCSDAIREYPKLKLIVESNDTSNLCEYLIGERSGIPSAIYKFKSAVNFAKAISLLLRSVGYAVVNTKPKSFHNPRRLSYSNYGVMECGHKDIDQQDWQIHLPKGTEMALGHVYQAVHDAIKEAEDLGQSKGQNLLFQLNSGSLSIDDFNNAATKSKS